MFCPKEPHYQITRWEVTGKSQSGQPIQTLYAVCLNCKMKIAIKTSETVE